MKLDFWNNPLVVSALRVRYRKGGILKLSTTWLLVLVGMGALVQVCRESIEPPYEFNMPWYQFYFFVLLGLQWIISAGTGSLTVASSMHAEVSNRTLDFQRMAAITPRQLLVGKLFGEPIQAYLLAMTSFPVAVWCWAVGVPGLTLPVLLLFYFNVFTTVLMFSANGLVVPLDLKDGKAQPGGAWFLVYLGSLASVTASWTGSATAFGRTTLFSLAALATPAPAYFGVIQGDAFLYPVVLFGLSAPCLLVTPLCQLAAAAVFFRVMERRLTQPLVPTLGKPMAYGLLLAIDVLTAGLLANPGPEALAPVPRVVVFGVVHLAASLILIGLATPSRETLSSWVWRYRGRRPWWRDLLLAERSPTHLMAWPCSAIGVGALGALVIAPALAQDPLADPIDVMVVALAAWGLVTLLTLIGTCLTQWATFTVKADATATSIVLLGVTDFAIHASAEYFRLPGLRQMSASAHAFAWVEGQERLNPLPLLLTCAAVALGLYLVWRRRLWKLETDVDARLREMGIVAPR